MADAPPSYKDVTNTDQKEAGTEEDPEAQEQEEEYEEPNLCVRIWQNPFMYLSFLIFGVAAIIALALAFIDGGIVVYLVGLISCGWGLFTVCVLGSIGTQIKRFKVENQKLKRNNEELEGNINEFAAENEKFHAKNDQLEKCVQELNAQNDRLGETLDGFTDLRESIEQWAKENQQDVREFLDQTNALYSKMDDLQAQQERTILLDVAQRLEFMDSSIGMSRVEFTRFKREIPKRYQEAFKKMNKITFEDIAGEDGIIDINELQGLINELIKNAELEVRTPRDD